MNKQRIDLQAAAAMIAASDRTLFFLHVSPDGDSIGSTLAMVRALKQSGREAIIVGVDPVPRIYHFLEGWDSHFVPWQQVSGNWDLACFLDCGDLERVGDALPVAKLARRSLNVDHHVTNTIYGEYNYLDFSAAAVGELAYLLLREMGLPTDQETATCLYTAIVTDTGGFQYDSTSPGTHRIAAELIEAGVRPYDVSSAVYENESVAKLLLLGRVLATLEVDSSGLTASVLVTREMMAKTGAKEEDADGLVNYARSVSGVEVGMMFKESPDGSIKVGFRSRHRVDVGAIAKGLGGGGHARAAGCSLSGTLVQVQERVHQAVRAAL